RAEYGLLGVEFDVRRTGRLRFEVGWSHGNGPAWAEALASSIDSVRLGLPREFARAVLNGLVSTLGERLPSGIVHVTDGAHGLVGSSARFFERLACTVADLMLLNGVEFRDDQLATFLSASLV